MCAVKNLIETGQNRDKEWFTSFCLESTDEAIACTWLRHLSSFVLVHNKHSNLLVLQISYFAIYDYSQRADYYSSFVKFSSWNLTLRKTPSSRRCRIIGGNERAYMRAILKNNARKSRSRAVINGFVASTGILMVNFWAIWVTKQFFSQGYLSFHD